MTDAPPFVERGVPIARLTTVGTGGPAAYFARPVLQMLLKQPLNTANRADQYDVNVTVKGGGLSGQAEAIRLGVTRSLMQINASFRPALKKAGYVTRDPRIVERKKYGQRGARARFQFSKR